MVSRDFNLVLIGGLTGSSAIFTLYGNFPAALILFFLGAGFEVYLRRKGVINV